MWTIRQLFKLSKAFTHEQLRKQIRFLVNSTEELDMKFQFRNVTWQHSWLGPLYAWKPYMVCSIIPLKKKQMLLRMVAMIEEKLHYIPHQCYTVCSIMQIYYESSINGRSLCLSFLRCCIFPAYTVSLEFSFILVSDSM